MSRRDGVTGGGGEGGRPNYGTAGLLSPRPAGSQTHAGGGRRGPCSGDGVRARSFPGEPILASPDMTPRRRPGARMDSTPAASGPLVSPLLGSFRLFPRRGAICGSLPRVLLGWPRLGASWGWRAGRWGISREGRGGGPASRGENLPATVAGPLTGRAADLSLAAPARAGPTLIAVVGPQAPTKFPRDGFGSRATPGGGRLLRGQASVWGQSG